MKNKLVAAYLPGTKVTQDDFFDLQLMNGPDEKGGFVTWNTLKILNNRNLLLTCAHIFELPSSISTMLSSIV